MAAVGTGAQVAGGGVSAAANNGQANNSGVAAASNGAAAAAAGTAAGAAANTAAGAAANTAGSNAAGVGGAAAASTAGAAAGGAPTGRTFGTGAVGGSTMAGAGVGPRAAGGVNRPAGGVVGARPGGAAGGGMSFNTAARTAQAASQFGGGSFGSNVARAPAGYGSPAGYGAGGYAGGAGGYGAGAGGGMAGGRLPEEGTDPRPEIEIPISACGTDHVRVFTDKAQVSRKCNLKTNAGYQDVIIYGLSPEVDTESFKVTCLGNARIIEVGYSEALVEPDDADVPPEVEQMESDIVQLRALRAKFEDALDRNTKELALVEKFAQRLTATSGAAEPLPDNFVASFDAFMDMYRQRLRDHDEKDTELNAKIRDVDSRIDTLKDQVAEHRPAEAVVVPRMTISLYAPGELMVTLEIAYMVTGVAWKPAYDIRVNSNRPQISLTYYGLVKQATGEDWEGVKLVLTTADSATVAPPHLAPATVRLIDDENEAGPSIHESSAAQITRVRKRVKRRKRPAAASSMSDDDEVSVVAGSSASTPAVTVDLGELTFDFPSTGKYRRVTLGTIPLEAEFMHYVVPRVSDKVYLKVVTRNTTALTLLGGVANIFLNSAFVARTGLTTIGSGKPIDLFIGADNDVKFEYGPLKKDEGPQNFRGKRQKHTYARQSVVTNRKMIPVRLIITDQLPLPSTNEIRVNLISPDPKGEIPIRIDPTTNQVTWTVGIQQQQVQGVAINFNYEVEFPRGKAISDIQ